jgi:hypothetical protein
MANPAFPTEIGKCSKSTVSMPWSIGRKVVRVLLDETSGNETERFTLVTNFLPEPRASTVNAAIATDDWQDHKNHDDNTNTGSLYITLHYPYSTPTEDSHKWLDYFHHR